MRRWLALLAGAAVLLTQTACTGRELYERLLIHAMGVDYAAGEYVVTVRSASAPGEEHEEFYTCRGRTVALALGELSRSTGREPFYAHNYLVLFGEDCARAHLPDAVDFFLRYHNTHPTVQLALARGEAADLLTYEENGKLLPIARLEELGEAQADTGRALRMELLEFINTARREGASPLLPGLALTDDGPVTRGAVFFREGVWAGELTGEDLLGFLAAKSRLEGGFLRVEDPALGEVTVELTGCHAGMEVTPRGEGAAVALTVTVEGDAVSLDGGRARLSPGDYPLAEALLAGEVEKRIRGLWAKTAGVGCDVLGVGAALYRKDPGAWQGLRPRWGEILAACEPEVRVTGHISRLEGEGPSTNPRKTGKVAVFAATGRKISPDEAKK